MKLHSEFVGTGRPVAFLHGFTQTGYSWRPVIDIMKVPTKAQLIDAPGHGNTETADRNLEHIGRDIVETISKGVLVGYSMGARMALHAALTGSPKITALCLISGTPGLESPMERDSRIKQDNELAAHIEEIGVPTFIIEWLSQPLFDGLTSETNQFNDRLRNSAAGLATSLRWAGTGTQSSLWGVLSSITIPVLIVAGERDIKFADIARKMASLIPQSELHIMEDVGHTAHLENPEQFVKIFERWLLKCDEQP